MAKNKVGSILLDTLCLSECISRSGLLVDQLLRVEGVAHAPGHADVVSAVHEEVVHNHLQLSWSCHLHQRYTTHLEHGHIVVGQVPHAGVLGVLVRQSRAVVGLQELLTGE